VRGAAAIGWNDAVRTIVTADPDDWCGVRNVD
jgi:hypothetical protein